MLKQRILTAIVLFVLLAGVLSLDSAWPFLVFLALICGLAGWEWTRLTVGRSSPIPVILGVALFVLSIAQAYFWLSLGWTSALFVQIAVFLSVSLWFFAVSTALFRAQVTTPVAPLLWTAFAMVTLFATWGALAEIYLAQGVLYVLSLLVLVWIADVGAYFVGRAFGRRKLAPAISPGKTREGALAGIAGVVLWVLVSAQWPSTFGEALILHWGVPGAIVLSIILAIFSISGDLFESLLKRRAGVKDSSTLLPGHGGVYDRIDAVVAVVPLAYLLTGGMRF